jgi:hypothetical protein
MPPRRTLLDDGEDFPMAGAPIGSASTSGPIALDFGAPRETLFQQLMRHWLNERHAPDILPVQAEVLGALLDHIRRQVRWLSFLRMWAAARIVSDRAYSFCRRIQSRRCAEILTRPRQSTRGSCSCRPKSNASNSSCALISVRGCTR